MLSNEIVLGLLVDEYEFHPELIPEGRVRPATRRRL